ncbi:MAG TPA: polysaccharide biosynthesis C-terminal domain-containing protein [Allosphingosinicella sp.]
MAAQFVRGLVSNGIGIATVLATRVGGALLTLLMNSLVARLYGLEVAGRFFVFIALSVMVSVVVRGGLDTLLLRISSTEHPWITRFSLVYGMSGVALLTCACTLISVTVALLVPEALLRKYGLPGDLPWIIVSGFSFAVANIGAAIVQGRGKPNLTTAIRSSATPVAFMVLLAMLSAIADIGETGLRIIYAAASVAVGVFAIALSLGKAAPEAGDLPISPSHRRDIVRSASAFYVVALLSMFILWFPQVYSAAHIAPGALAGLVFSLRISNSATMLIAAVNLLYAPYYAQLHSKGDSSALERIVQTSTLASGAMSLVLLAAAILFARPILEILAPGLGTYEDIFRLAMVAQFLSGVGGPRANLLSMTHHEHDVLVSMIATAVICLASCVLLIGAMGAVGAALAVIVTTAAMTVLSASFVYRRLDILPFGLGILLRRAERSTAEAPQRDIAS